MTDEAAHLEKSWNAAALRMVDICAHLSDHDPDIRLARGYDEKGYPPCPFGYVLRANGHDYRRRRNKPALSLTKGGVVPSAAYVIPITLYLSAITSNPNTSTATPPLSDAPTPTCLPTGR